MKKTKLFHIMVLATVLALLAVAVPAAPALAAAVTLSPTSAEIGDIITVTGSGYTPTSAGGTPYANYVRVYLSPQSVNTGTAITSLSTYGSMVQTYAGEVGTLTEGNISTTFVVPAQLTTGTVDEDVHGGTYYVYTTQTTNAVGFPETTIVTKDTLTIIAEAITIDPDEGPVGTEVEITGEDFATNSNITVEYDGDEIDIDSGDTKTGTGSDAGEFTSYIIIPESVAGEHTITVSDSASPANTASAVFTVEPEIEISSTSGVVGDAVTVSGTGFGDEVEVTIKFGGTEIQTGDTDDLGSFDITFVVPAKGAGTYTVEARDEDNNRKSTSFTIGARMTVNPGTGNVGFTPVVISGTGFPANTPVTITYANQPTATVVTTATDANGSFAYSTFTVPVSQHGPHTITVVGGTTTLTTTFTVESAPPPVPTPLLPETDAKPKQPIAFDWGDVTDPSSPVTYDFQIGSDAQFTALVLEKTGLTTSQYTMIEAEKLQSTSKDAPYYWRVRATDAASNTSNWSTPQPFTVGFTFEFSGWVMYTILGLGGLLLLLVGYLLGRKSTYF